LPPTPTKESEDHDRRISDIALEAGFSDLSHFNRLFHARFGETPTAVRRALKKNNDIEQT